MIGNIQKLILLTLITLVTVSCQNGRHPNEQLDTKNNEGIIIKREFMTKDQRTKFIIINNDQLNNTYVNQITSDTQKFYNKLIPNYENKNYKWDKQITIDLKMGDGISTGMKKNISLYNAVGGNYLLCHELTHTLLGFGNQKANEFNIENGYFSQEGMAVYLQEKLDPQKKVFPTNSLKLDSIVKYLNENNRIIPLENLASNTLGQTYFNSSDKEISNKLLWESYIEAGSFVKYLIDNYGINKFLKVYNSHNFKGSVKKVYGEELKDLEKEWLINIDTKAKSLDMNERVQILYP
ncbi:hypothetical protein [Priestia aryabhattai]|uniref:hypothetical protein n=1 Tax=Priestia aryabhattai TaxID=412384 RepID=UPI00064F0A6D|nr:hypothetical protein [Priestia aryabhattai]KML31371.1 hypothetical protein VL11_02105 [Priestia aryabhattai]KMN92471.1 hypothetical protein ABV89_27055 [Priestia aryabhattai]MCA1052872.1 hypothetical protein [Priestia aryabhattai]